MTSHNNLDLQYVLQLLAMKTDTTLAEEFCRPLVNAVNAHGLAPHTNFERIDLRGRD